MAQLFYRSIEEMCAALRLCDDPSSWGQPTQRFELRDPDGGAAWLLRVEGPVAGVAVTDYEVRLDGETATIREGDQTVVYRIAGHRTMTSLWQAVPLVSERAGAVAPVTFLHIDSPERFVEVARANLMLGNDRMRYVPLGAGEALLRIEGMSAFLLEKWRDDPALRIYRPSRADPRFLLPDGWDYPLADKLHLAPGEEDDLWLVDAGERWRHVRARLEDIYERVDIDARRLDVKEYEPAGEVPKITVALRLTPSERTDRPQLWVLGAEERDILEHLLAEATEAELNNLQIACVADPEGRAMYVIVERHGAMARLAPPIRGGSPFIASLPEEWLYLPLGHSLQPLLSRRSLIEALGLSEDHLTIVDQAAGGRLKVIRIPRDLLAPITAIVDYFAGQAAAEVATLLEQVDFDFDLEASFNDDRAEPPPSWWRRLLRSVGLGPRGR